MADEVTRDDREFPFSQHLLYLEGQLEKCRLKRHELKAQNKKLVSRCTFLEGNKKDIAEYLKYAVVEENKEVEELESEKQSAEQAREAVELLQSQRIQKLQEQEDELRRITAPEEPKQPEQPDLSESDLVEPDLEAKLEEADSQNKNVKHRITDLMCVAEFKRQRVAEEIKKAEEAEEAKRAEAAQEEEEEDEELMEPQLEPLRSLVNYTNALYKQLGKVTSATKEEKAKKINLLMQSRSNIDKVVHRLQTTCLKLEEKLEKLKMEIENMLAQEELLRQHLATCPQKDADVRQLGVDLQRENRRTRMLEGIMYRASELLRHIVDSDTDEDLHRLLRLLDSIAPREETVNQRNKDPSYLLVKYRSGDFGFAPLSGWKGHRSPKNPTTPHLHQA